MNRLKVCCFTNLLVNEMKNLYFGFEINVINLDSNFKYPAQVLVDTLNNKVELSFKEKYFKSEYISHEILHALLRRYGYGGFTIRENVNKYISLFPIIVMSIIEHALIYRIQIKHDVKIWRLVETDFNRLLNWEFQDPTGLVEDEIILSLYMLECYVKIKSSNYSDDILNRLKYRFPQSYSYFLCFKNILNKWTLKSSPYHFRMALVKILKEIDSILINHGIYDLISNYVNVGFIPCNEQMQQSINNIFNINYCISSNSVELISKNENQLCYTISSFNINKLEALGEMEFAKVHKSLAINNYQFPSINEDKINLL